MTFIESISSVFDKYATGAGRASRSEYWWWYLFQLLLRLGVMLLASLADKIAGSILISFVGLFLFLPGICVAIRRCHDSGHSGWWVICPIVGFIMMFLPSDPHENEYGMPEF